MNKSTTLKAKTEEDTESAAFITFINEKCENVIDPLTINQMILEYKKITGTEKDINVFQRRIRVYRSNIHNRKDLNLETKAKQLFALGASLSTKFIKELEKEGIVKTDNKKRITKFIAKDGSLKLEGDHSFPSKIKANWVTRKRNSQGLNGVEDDEIEKETETKKSRLLKNRTSNEETFNRDINESWPPSPIRNQLNFGVNENSTQIDANNMNTLLNDLENVRERNHLEMKKEPFLIGRDVETRTIHNQKSQVKSEIVSSFTLRNTLLNEADANISIPPAKHKKFLESIQGLIFTLDVPIEEKDRMRIEQTKKRIDALEKREEILKMEGKDKKKIERTIRNIETFVENQEKLTMKGIQATVSACIFIVTKGTKESTNEDSTSVRDFLLLLRNAINSLELKTLDYTQRELKIAIDEFRVQDKRVPVEKIQSALRLIINIVAP